VNHYYCDLGFWRASDQAAVARHLTDRTRMSGEPNAAPRRAGLLRSALGRVSKPSAVGIVLATNRPYSANIAPSGLLTGLCRAPKRRF